VSSTVDYASSLAVVKIGGGNSCSASAPVVPADLGLLAHRLRRLQGDSGDFAITAFDRHGLLWADRGWWEIDPIGNVNEPVAEAVFCMAWVLARRLRRADAAQAYAHAITAAAVSR
jgi:hypothetical protein